MCFNGECGHGIRYLSVAQQNHADAFEILAATVALDNATDKGVEWSSNKTDIATVDVASKVTAVTEGTATRMTVQRR